MLIGCCFCCLCFVQNRFSDVSILSSHSSNSLFSRFKINPSIISPNLLICHFSSCFLFKLFVRGQFKGEVFCFCFFCTLSLIVRIFPVTYDVLQHYYDERFSHKSWSSLLTSPLVENNRDEGAYQVFQQFVQKGHFKR